MAGRGISGLAVVEIGAGLIVAWAGIENVPIAAALGALARGHAPPKGPAQQLLVPSTGGGALTGAQANTNSAVANDFQSYAGKVPYRWGGASPVTGWDCSGACNFVICHDNNIAIPTYAGGTFTGQTHGPPTLVWLAWAPLNMQSLSAAEVQAGDLIIWQTHMGVAISTTEYVSAYDSAEGTAVNPIHGGGPAGEVPTYWRLKGVS